MMTDLEISKALALAIGWKLPWCPKESALVYVGGRNKVKYGSKWAHGWRIFDYRDWNVIGPIAEKYDCFPAVAACHNDEWIVLAPESGAFIYADTPQKAIALAVIGST